MYRFLDKFNPIEGDCGALCGAACCLCSTDPGDNTPRSETDENADYSMGLYLLPGEEQGEGALELALPRSCTEVLFLQRGM